jgi:hypothetical protein
VANKCPDWIFDILTARVCIQFLSDSHPLEMSSSHFIEQLQSAYVEIDPKLIAETAEHMVRFLGEVDAGEEAVNVLNDFIYFRMNYETTTKQRNLKPLFGDPEDGAALIKHFEGLKRFKAYVFGIRSNNSPTSPPGWDAARNAENLPIVLGLVSTSINPLDLF